MSADNTVNADTAGATRTRRTPAWLAATIAILFGLVYAYSAWSGLGNLIGLNTAAQSLDTTLSGFGWGLLLAGVLGPILVFGIAFWLGRRREAGPQALLLLAGLCLVSALSLDIFVFGLGSLIV
ncbi:bacitracin resistance protein [Cryobacterium sp. W22_MBD10_FK3]|uniref:bacitracin resistance protein n=1 Tax=Cryobacterium sp. W22_MBD10_FK3 TaxID=3240273 RepID=UPI003F90F7FE